jgi:gas vesicle protein
MSQQYGNLPNPNDVHYDRGYGNGNSGVADFATGNPSASMTSPLGQSMGQQGFGGQFHEDFDAATRPNSAISAAQGAGVNRSASSASTAVAHGQTNSQGIPSRNNTLKKKASMRRTTGATGSLKRSGSRKSLAAGSIKSVAGGNETEDYNSAFYTPVPTHGSPTDILANRFQSWRQLLKSLIAYFREIQSSYDTRAKAATKIQSAISGITHPAVMLSNNGLADATRILEDFHRHSLAEANKSREIENDVISGLSGLRSDLSQKIKEIKSLSGDFKNSVDKEKEATRREVEKLQEALQHADHEDSSAGGKSDPYVVRLGVDRAVEKQIDEENYLHRVSCDMRDLLRTCEQSLT